MSCSINILVFSSYANNDFNSLVFDKPYVNLNVIDNISVLDNIIEGICKYDIILTDEFFEKTSTYISTKEYARCRFVISKDVCFAFGQYLILDNVKNLLDAFDLHAFSYDLNKTIIENAIEFIDRYPFLDNIKFDNGIQTLSNAEDVPTLLIAIGLTGEEIKNYRSVFASNIVGYFDFQQQICLDFSGKTLSDGLFEKVVFVNTLNRSANIDRFLRKYENKKILTYGNFCENDKLYGDDYWEPLELESETPIVLIISAGPDLEKFWLQNQIYEQLNEKGIKHQQISYSPLSAVSDNFIYKEFPQKIIFPDYINEVRSLITKIDSTCENEAIIINVGSGVAPIGNVDNFFGSLIYAYLNALNVDMVIYSINPQISYDKIIRDISYLKSRGVNEVVLFVSENVYLRRLIADGRICTFKISESADVENYISAMQGKFKVYSKDDVKKAKLTDYIYHVFTHEEENNCENG